jgi:hypothetical protein
LKEIQMPKVTGPLMSIGARGTIAKTLNYRQTKRGTIARVHSQPSGNPTEAQLSIRAITKQVAQAWASVSPTDKLTWDNLAESNSYSAFNAFFVINFSRVSIGQDITNVWPAEETIPPAAYVVTGTPDPDVTGTYLYEGEVEGYSRYKHETLDFYIYFWEEMGHWAVSDFGDPEIYWEKTNSVISGIYYGVGTDLTVSLP